MNSVICFDQKGKKHQVSISKLSFRPSVYGVVIQDDKILFSRQWDGYDFPGGGVEIEETIESALKREVKEETGLNIQIVKLLACEDSFFKLPVSNKFVHSILIYYLCQSTGGRLSIRHTTDEEKIYLGQPEWINIEDIFKIKFYNSIDSIKLINEAKMFNDSNH